MLVLLTASYLISSPFSVTRIARAIFGNFELKKLLIGLSEEKRA